VSSAHEGPHRRASRNAAGSRLPTAARLHTARSVTTLLLVTALGLGFLTACSLSSTISVEIGSAGGEARSPDHAIRIQIPPGTLPEGSRIEFTTGRETAPAALAEGIDPLADPVDVRSAEKPTGAEVRIAFNPQSDLPEPESDTPAATTENAFIAVYDNQLEQWVPLATNFDSTTNELVAGAPYFAPYQTFVVKPGRLNRAGTEIVSDVTTSGVEAFGMFMAERFRQGVLDIAGETSEAERIDCSSYAPDWTVGSFRLGSACVTQDAAGAVQLQIQNNSSLQLVAAPPAGLNIAELPGDAPSGDIYYALSNFIQGTRGAAVLKGPGSKSIGIPGNPTSLTVPLTADWLGVALDIISAADLFIPQEALSEAAAEFGIAAQAIRDLPDPPREVQQAVALTRVELKRAEPAGAAAAPAVLDAAECLTNPSSSEFDPLNGVGTDVDYISPAAIKCASEMYSSFAGEEIPMGPILAELEISLKAMPEFADFIRFGNDWATVQALQPAALGYPSCENYVVRGRLGEIDVRSDTAGQVLWSIVLYSPESSIGRWVVETYLDGLPTGSSFARETTEPTIPSGSVSARRSQLFQVQASLTLSSGDVSNSLPNTCYVP